MLEAFSRQPGPHQLGRGRGGNDFTVQRDMIRMRVADKDFIAPLRFVRIQPKPELRQMDSSAVKPDFHESIILTGEAERLNSGRGHTISRPSNIFSV